MLSSAPSRGAALVTANIKDFSIAGDTVVCMAMTLRLADDEAEALRRRAELEHRSMQEAALPRPQATAFGKDAYPDLDAKAYDLVMSVAEGRVDSVEAIAAMLATQPRR